MLRSDGGNVAARAVAGANIGDRNGGGARVATPFLQYLPRDVGVEFDPDRFIARYSTVRLPDKGKKANTFADSTE